MARAASGQVSEPPVARMKISSRLTLASPLLNCAATSASVPSATFSPFFRMRTCVQTSSRRWSRWELRTIGRALARPAHDGVLHPADAERIEARERLVEEHHLRRMQEPAGDHELLLHARGRARPGSDVGLVGELELLQERLAPRSS